MKQTKIYGISGLMILLLPILMINVVAISSWPVQKDDELKYSLSYKYYDEDDTQNIDRTVSFNIIIKNVDINITYDVIFDVTEEDEDWAMGLMDYYESPNLNSTDEFLIVYKDIIYEATAFANKENDWATFINMTKEYFWVDAYTFSTYSADEITNMDFSSSSNAYGYEITASWDDYENLPAGSYSTKIKYSQDGILLIYEYILDWEEGSGSNISLENDDLKKIYSFPLVIFGFCSILGIAVIILKNREKIL
ncbi:hypothetical protein ES708_16843 [subsurface metagenome]